MRIDVISDTVCPWCYVGKRHLELALAQRPDVAAEIIWRPYQLAPEVPAAGVDRQTYWREKFGESKRLDGMVSRLKEAGDAVGLGFDFENIQVQPNTLASHTLLHWATGKPQQDDLKEAILDAFFVQGEDIGDHETLVGLAGKCGLDIGEARTALGSERLRTEVQSLVKQARDLGISGVPTFIFDSSRAVSGAQPVEVLTQLIDELRG